jgi:hypothetical protein
MRKKGETGVDDRSKPQTEKKERDDKRKKKKSARLERQQSRKAWSIYSWCAYMFSISILEIG